MLLNAALFLGVPAGVLVCQYRDLRERYRRRRAQMAADGRRR